MSLQLLLWDDSGFPAYASGTTEIEDHNVRRHILRRWSPFMPQKNYCQLNTCLINRQLVAWLSMSMCSCACMCPWSMDASTRMHVALPCEALGYTTTYQLSYMCCQLRFICRYKLKPMDVDQIIYTQSDRRTRINQQSIYDTKMRT